MRSAPTSQQWQSIAVVALLAAVLGVFAQPGAAWPTDVAILSVIVLLIAGGREDAASVRQRQRNRRWLVPAMTLAIAIQLVVVASVGHRLRAVALGGGLVAAGLAWSWTRRRDA